MSSVEQPQTLEELTTTAFCEQPIRNAVLIDEQFPKLSDALESLDSSEEDTSLATKFSEWETAKELYEAFHKLKISCDVENDPSGLGELSAKIKKSDLVVLDLHLRDSTDATDSIDVIKSLASDTKFNLVVVYTKDDQLRRIAFQLAGSVRGCDEIENSDSEVSLASIKDDLGKYDLPVEQMAIDHIRGRKLSGEEVGKLRGDLAKEHKIVHGEQELVLSALTSHLLRDQYGALAEKPISIASEMNFDRPTPWMVFPNMFVVVAHKGTTRPNELLTVLKDAILDWKPGIVRTIISQIQNTMADSGYAFAGSLTSDIETQIAWLWHAKKGPQQPAAIEMLIQRMILSLRASLGSNDGLSQFISSCISTLPDLADPSIQIQKLAEAISGSDVEGADVLHALNCFESTEDFSTDYITTGTVLLSKHCKYGDQWWVCVEPACDTIPGQASSKDKFLQCRLLELRNCTSEKAEIILKATRSRYVFVKHDSKREFLDSLNKTTAQPKLVTGFVKKQDQVVADGENKVLSVFFPDKSKDDIGFFDLEMQVVAQLQEPYANRLLQEAGNQLSRIGLNFVDLPKKPEE